MHIVAISDLHGQLPKTPECDLLIIAGDVCPDFRATGNDPNRQMGYGLETSGYQQANWLQDEFAPWLRAQPAKQIVGIAGNHDYVFEHSQLVPDLPWIYLQDSGITIGGDSTPPLKIWGTPWVPNLPAWAFYGTYEKLDAACHLIPSDTDILISHGPPHGVLDVVGSKYGPREGFSVGNPSLNEAIDRVRPRYVICGHIHEQHGHESIAFENSVTHVYNVSLLDDNYEMVYGQLNLRT